MKHMQAGLYPVAKMAAHFKQTSSGFDEMPAGFNKTTRRFVKIQIENSQIGNSPIISFVIC